MSNNSLACQVLNTVPSGSNNYLAPVLLTFKVGVPELLLFVNLTRRKAPVTKAKSKPSKVTDFAANVEAVEHIA